MKRLLVFVGKDADYVEQFEAEAKKLSAITGVVSKYSTVCSLLREIFKRQLKSDSFVKNEAFATPLVMTAQDARLFYSKVADGVHAVQSFEGASFKDPQELLDYFEKKVGAKAYGEDWLFKTVLKSIIDSAPGVYLVKGASDQDITTLKKLYGDSLFIAQQTAGGDEEVKADVDEIVSTQENINTSTIALLTSMKSKWTSKKEKVNE